MADLAETDPEGRCRICVATITRKRPLMLGALLASLSELHAPEGTELCFLVVDNDDLRSAEQAFSEFRGTVPGEVRYTVEPREGIPFARNRALAEARAMQADYLAFVDDDETVCAEWLAEMFGGLRGRRLELVGGPVRCSVWPTDVSPNWWQNLIFAGIGFRYLRKERSANRRRSQGTENDIVIVTNNWLLDLAWQKRTNLRFDERLRWTGGSDASFFRQAKALGLKTGWCETAIVTENIPLSRMTFTYQFHRARNQSIASFRRNYPDATVFTTIGAVSSTLMKALGALACCIALPFAGGAALVQLARQSGWAVGRIQALMGQDSTLYSSADGA